MKIVFLSTFLNHHQLPLCNAFFRMKNVEFQYISVMPVSQECLKLGYRDMNNECDFVIKAYESTEKKNRAIREMKKADVLICVVNIWDYLTKEEVKDKLVFLYMERIFKKVYNLEFALNIPRSIKNHTLNRGKNIFVLCAGAYVESDLKKICAYKGRMYRWGYFPEVFERKYEDAVKLKSSEIVRILWAGRFLDWKRPQQALEIAKKLKEKGYNFQLDMVGGGDLENEIKKQVCENKLEGCVNLMGFVPAEQVRTYMDRADIFLFTSNRIEGWGAVLNEAMSSRCAVVANWQIGAVPFLVRHNKNGLVYNGTVEDLLLKTECLVNDKEKRLNLGEQAYRMMHEYWNADVAADHFVRLSQSLLSGEKNKMDLKGPCSYIG